MTKNRVAILLAILLISTSALFITKWLDKPSPIKYPRCVPGSPYIFYDAAGKVVKAIHPVHESKPDDPDDGEGGGTFRIVELNGCRSGDFAALARSEGRSEGLDLPQHTTDSIEFYSADGRLLWSKKMLHNRGGIHWQMSRNDRRVWYISEPDVGSGDGPAMVALSADGKEDIFRFKPTDRLTFRTVSLSHNGRYVWIYIWPSERGGKEYKRFYDLETGKTHDYTGEGYPEVSDGGLIEIWAGRMKTVEGTISKKGKLVHKHQL